MYAKEIREINKKEMVSRTYLVAKCCLLGCHCLNLGIESCLKRLCIEQAIVSLICNSGTPEDEAGRFVANLEPSSAI